MEDATPGREEEGGTLGSGTGVCKCMGHGRARPLRWNHEFKQINSVSVPWALIPQKGPSIKRNGRMSSLSTCCSSAPQPSGPLPWEALPDLAPA